MKFKGKVSIVGKEVSRFLNEGILLVFSAESLMTQVKNYSVMIDEIEVFKDIQIGDKLFVGEESFKITAVGNIAQQNLTEIGHATFKADGSTEAELPGTIYLEKKVFSEIKVNDTIIIK